MSKISHYLSFPPEYDTLRIKNFILCGELCVNLSSIYIYVQSLS